MAVRPILGGEEGASGPPAGGGRGAGGAGSSGWARESPACPVQIQPRLPPQGAQGSPWGQWAGHPSPHQDLCFLTCSCCQLSSRPPQEREVLAEGSSAWLQNFSPGNSHNVATGEDEKLLHLHPPTVNSLSLKFWQLWNQVSSG